MPLDLRRAQPSVGGVYGGILVTTAVVFAFLATAIGTDTPATQRLDDKIAPWAHDLTADQPWLHHVFEGFAAAFSTLPVAAVLLVIVVVSLWRREPRIAVWSAASGLLVLLGNPAIKAVFERPRPPWDEPLHEIGGWSFPSGHSSGAGMLCTVLVLLTIVLTGRGWRRRLLITVWVLLGLATAASRVFLGVHYFTDVVAGLVLGIFVTVLAWVVVVASRPRLPSELAVLTGTGARRVAVVLNPAKVGDVEDFKARVLQVALQHGWSEPHWFETSVEDPGYGQAQQALELGVDLIIAAGGDGTVRAVCEEAARTGVAIGVIPHGTGNLLARNLGVPLNSRDALEVAFGGQDKAIDLATFRTDSDVDTTFLVMAGLGMDAMIMTGVDDNLKQKVGWAAYFVSGVKALRFPGMKVTITVDDEEPRTFRARTVVIGNVGFLQAGIPLLPEARIDDGRLDVVVLAPRRFFGWLAIVARVLTRQKRTNDRLDRFTGRVVRVSATSPTPMQLDGDPVGEGLEITAEVHPGVLLVRVPALPTGVAG
ncbi:hypothetical protein ASD11_16170 [Aeromicrobium sp. Root495]|uniref:phosphatase PAP2 family protein n=1 Tax=Aeromicrobium sp. Root495 TaxID=1736550 RepID=UPI0006FAB798|nr:phosphatase PAP2 family protein [Aeromicrobium sp. Root495]KQY56013.1 hypothetical protein ASD11_16170 [Aeromicrobium sp. Root495]